MKQIVLITGPTGTGKSDLACRIASVKDAVLIPMDQLQLYMHLEVGIGLDLSRFTGLRVFGYQILDPWMVFGPKKYISWLRSCLLRFANRNVVIIEGGCTSYLRQLVTLQPSDPLLRAIRIVALDPGNNKRKRFNAIYSFYSEKMVQSIIDEVKYLRALGFYNDKGISLFRECEKTFVHTEAEDKGLAWALRISARVYYPAHLASVSEITLSAARKRIVDNVFDIQEYQLKRIKSFLDASCIHSVSEGLRVLENILDCR